MANYAVGDIQGCLKLLEDLLASVNFDSNKDILWVAGDLVNRGPDSLGTLRYLKSLGKATRVVLGNHDLHLIAVYYGFKKMGKNDTFREILQAEDGGDLIEWLCQQPLIQHDETLGYTMTHAGIPHIWSTEQALNYAKEVHQTVRNSDTRASFLENMYGNQPDYWNEHLQGIDRLRLITNYFTRMRFISTSGQLNLDEKGKPESTQENIQPWFEFSPNRNTQIIFGHWAALEGLFNNKYAIGIDTGAVWGGMLTLLKLENGTLFHQRA